MLATILHQNKEYKIDLSKPIDISIPLKAGVDSVSAFYIPPVQIEPIRFGNFVGAVNEGGSCNVNNIFFNPHGNGTHTECVGHISSEPYFINDSLKTFFFTCLLVSVLPHDMDNGDSVILKSQLQQFPVSSYDALIIRTLPNSKDKQKFNYSGSNPAYLHNEAAAFIRDSGVKHLLIDLPSVDKEDDGGKLLAHHAYWNYPAQPRTDATITEMIFVDQSIIDGVYFLNLQITSLENDASPSKPVLFAVK